MFSWKRTENLSCFEPTEEEIWAAIDAQDLRGNVDLEDRLEQHYDMLVGRDTYQGFFLRSPILPKYTPKSINYKDLPELVRPLEIQMGEFYPLERHVAEIKSGWHDTLQPASDILEDRRDSNLLSHRILNSNTLDWPYQLTLGKALKPPRGYVVWARYILQAHKPILKRAGVYKAIYASLFDYSNIPYSWARGVMEAWDSDMNTCWFGPQEMTITLREMGAVSGLPVYGNIYEECIPPDEVLFDRKASADGDRRGKLKMPPVFPDLLHHYQRVYADSKLPMKSRATMPASTWIQSFLRERFITEEATTPEDPFNLGIPFKEALSEQTAEPLLTEGVICPARPNISEDLCLAGFIATWLCYFVLPIANDSIRSSVLMAASKISRGERLALAPPTLARIFRVLRIISNSKDLKLSGLSIPWHYVNAWIHIHVHGAFSCARHPLFFTEKVYPIVIQLFKASSTFEKERIRLFFFAPHLVMERFAIVHQPEIFNLPSHTMNDEVKDAVDDNGKPAILTKENSYRLVEYLLSIRVSWLCFRLGDSLVVEGYHPNRVARQFGYTQVTADNTMPFISGVTDMLQLKSVPLETKLTVASAAWTHLLRILTNTHFYFADPLSRPGMGYKHQCWVRRNFGPLFEHGVRIYEPKVGLLGTPRNFAYVPNFAKTKSARYKSVSPNIQEENLATVPGNDNRGKADERTDTSRSGNTCSKERAKRPPPARVEDDSSHTRRRVQEEEATDPFVDPIPQQFEISEDCHNPKMPSNIDNNSGKTDMMEYANLEGTELVDNKKGKEPVDASPAQYPLHMQEQMECSQTSAAEEVKPQEESHIELQTIATDEAQENVIKSSALEIEEFEAEAIPPPTKYCVGETSGAKALENVEVCTITTREIVKEESVESSEQSPIDEEDTPSKVSDSIPEDTLYNSQIYSRYNNPYNPRNMPILLNGRDYLQDLVARIQPETPHPLLQFVNEANDTLDYLAGRGIPEDKLRYLEGWARSVEYVLWHVENLSIVQNRIPVAVRRKNVEAIQTAVKYLREKFLQSDYLVAQNLKQLAQLSEELKVVSSRMDHIYGELKIQPSSSMNEVGGLPQQMGILFQELEKLTVHRLNLQIESNKLKKMSLKEEKCLQLLQSRLAEAEAALAEAIKEWDTAKIDHAHIVVVIQPQLQHLYNLLN